MTTYNNVYTIVVTMNSKNTATVIKSGNSYALRIPKSYAVNNNLKIGEKIHLPTPMVVPTKTNHQEFQKVVKELQKLKLYSKIKDPVAWQRQQRKRSQQANREY